jgi:CRP-like cAMP-binding protein
MRAENLLLAALPREERRRFDPFLKPVELEFGEVLIEPNEPIKNLYFPFDCVTSTMQEMSDGSSVETGLMGIEGLVGVQLWLRVPSTPTRTLVQIPGRALRMSAPDFVEEVINKPFSPLNDLIARYTHAFLALTSMTAACNRLHTIDARLCRWLTMSYERKRQDEFPIRQEFIAHMLGVHRPTVSTAANMLQKAGLITYARGRMTILDPEGLKEGACECLELMETQFDRIFERPWRELAERADEEAGG